MNSRFFVRLKVFGFSRSGRVPRLFNGPIEVHQISKRNRPESQRSKTKVRFFVAKKFSLFDSSRNFSFSWLFAINAVLNEEIRPRYESYKWENIKAHLSRCREYRSIHFQELTGKLNKEQRKRAEVRSSTESIGATFFFVSFRGFGKTFGRFQSQFHSSNCRNRREQEEKSRTQIVVVERLDLVVRKQRQR